MEDFQISKKTKPRSDEPTPEQDRDEMMIDQEFRLSTLELEFFTL